MANRNTYNEPTLIAAPHLGSYVGTKDFDEHTAEAIRDLFILVQRLYDRIDILEQALQKSSGADAGLTNLNTSAHIS